MHDFVVYIEGVTATNTAGTNVVRVTTLKVAQLSGDLFAPRPARARRHHGRVAEQ